MTSGQVARARMKAQGLSGALGVDPAAAVARLGAVQAQDYQLAKWSIAQRLVDVTEGVIDRALADGNVLRMHVLRPTWHFVARDDLRWMQALTAPRVLARLNPYDRRAGIDAALIAKSTRTIAKAIATAGHLTRAEVTAALARGRVPVDSGWLVGQLLMHAELRGVICSGVPKGSQQTYALVDERAPAPASIRGDDALAELARRYFRSHAPATAQDFRWWSGLGAADVSRALDLLGPAVEPVRIGTTTYLIDPGAATEPFGPRPQTQAHLLQAWDELVVAYRETRHVVDRRGLLAQRNPEGLLARSVLLNDQMIGRWRRDLRAGQVVITVELAAAIDASGVKAITRATDEYGRFLGRSIQVAFVQPAS